ncbi:hypothetical protein FOMPIDRAFT_88986 [Fomitopsis schrenkii]|uniref:Uncharacterized protein n=1 Tax=Fomitopsis schrenkii TaxID=2126942 RepID=S8FLX8_FOMSC|nr:hypothetical protein FOMPIDRAFT_88986 [Fomitopsis schrenkii]
MSLGVVDSRRLRLSLAATLSRRTPSYGVRGFQAYIRRLNEYFASLVRTSSFALSLRVVTPPSLALTVFRVVADPCVLRDVIGDERTRREHIDRAWALVCEEAEEYGGVT